MEVLVIGDPADPATDVGPIIDAEARGLLDPHYEDEGRGEALAA